MCSSDPKVWGEIAFLAPRLHLPVMSSKIAAVIVVVTAQAWLTVLAASKLPRTSLRVLFLGSVCKVMEIF